MEESKISSFENDFRGSFRGSYRGDFLKDQNNSKNSSKYKGGRLTNQQRNSRDLVVRSSQHSQNQMFVDQSSKNKRDKNSENALFDGSGLNKSGSEKSDLKYYRYEDKSNRASLAISPIDRGTN